MNLETEQFVSMKPYQIETKTHAILITFLYSLLATNESLTSFAKCKKPSPLEV